MKLFATITEPLTHIIIRFRSYTYVTGFLHPNMISINSILSSVWKHILQCKSIGLVFYVVRVFTERCFRTGFNRNASFFKLNSLTRLDFSGSQCCKVFLSDICGIVFKAAEEVQISASFQGRLILFLIPLLLGKIRE